MAADDGLSELVASLRADGAVESEGHFTLDREQARSKMQKFQLADARRYVLELVQAAVLRDATQISFEIDADDMRMSFDGLPFAAAEIDDLYGSLFRPGDSRELRGVRQLALGLNAAMGMEPKQVLLRSGHVELRAWPGRPDEIVELASPAELTHIHVRKRTRLRLIVDFFANLMGQLGEEKYLERHCASAELAIHLDGRRISGGLRALVRDGAPTLSIDEPDFRGVLRAGAGSDPTRVHLHKDGVLIETRDLPDCGTGIEAVIFGERLRKDVSQAKIVDNGDLTAIVRYIRSARWQLWREALAAAEGPAKGELLAWIHTQLLEHAGVNELRGDDNAKALAETMTWPEARGDHAPVSLRALCDAIAAGQQLRYVDGKFPELAIEGAPILSVRKSETQRLARALHVEIVPARSLLERERLRARGRAEWLEREAEAVLPDHLPFNYRAAIIHEQVSGEVGIDHESQAFGFEHPTQIMLHLEGRLLGRLELDLGVPNTWLAIEADFTPTDNYRDAVRDRAFIRALVVALVSLASPLAELSAATQEEPQQFAVMRGVIKRWLIALLDRRSQVALLTKAGADVGRDHYIDVGELLPSLSRAGLLAAKVHAIAEQPLFGELDRSYVSLVELARRHAADGKLASLESYPQDERMTAPGVVILGPGDRKIVYALFGKVVEPFDLGPQRRKLEYLDRPQLEVAALRNQLALELAGVGLRADDWIVDLDGPLRGCVTLMPATDDRGIRVERLDAKTLARTSIRVLHDGRWLCEVETELGFGPLAAVLDASSPGLELRANETWDGIVDDAHWRRALAQLDHAGEQLFARVCELVRGETGGVARWLHRVLLHAIAKRASNGYRDWLTAAAQLPAFECLSGRTITYAGIEAIILEHGKLDVVGHEFSFMAVPAPEIIKADAGECAELKLIFGPDAIVSGEPRMQHHRVSDLLASRERMPEAEFEPDQVLVSMPIKDRDRRGHVGIPRARDGVYMVMRLGSGGYHLRDIHDHDAVFWTPIDAVIIDDVIPLDAQGDPDLESKRYQQLKRQVHRMIPALVIELCQRWPQLDAAARKSAWARLLAYLQRETGTERRQVRQRAYDAASAIQGFCDVWGRALSLRDVLSRGRSSGRSSGPGGGDPLRVLTRQPSPPPPDDLAGELILQVNPAELACLSAHMQVRELDECWAAELERLRQLAAAPKVERPSKLHSVALTQRKAAVSGDLECELWLPRDWLAGGPAGDWSPLDHSIAVPQLDFVREGRAVARYALSEILPCAGIVTGPGLVVHGPDNALDERQRASLLKQVLIMYLDAATRVQAGKVSGKDEGALMAYFAWVHHRLSRGGSELDELRKLGKQFERLRTSLQELVPPTLRNALQAQPPAPAPEPEPDPMPEPEPDPVPEPAAPARVEREPAPAKPLSPSQRVIAAIEEQLQWARRRHHRVLGELRLDTIEMRPTMSDAIAEVQLAGVAVNTHHPLIQRLLEQDPIDAHDLAFAVAAIYGLLNRVAEDITDDDERSFVAQLVEGLVLAQRAGRA